MAQVDLNAHLARIVGKPGKEREAVDLRLALRRYTDLVGWDFHGKQYWVSKEINVYADFFVIEKIGDQYLALPYISDMGIRIFCQPFGFYLGFDNPHGFGIIPYNDWESHPVNSNVSESLIRQMRRFLESHQPVDYL